MAVQLASAYMQIIPSMQGFQGTIAKQLAGEGATAGTAVGGRFTGGFRSVVGTGAIAGVVGGLAGTAAAAVGGALAGGFRAAGSAIIGFNSTLQQSTIGFTTMLGSAQKSQAFVSQLQQFAAKTPFEFQGLVKNANSLLGMGIASKDILPDLTALGDSVASVGGDSTVLNNTISAFGQIAAKGTVDMGNLNQLLQGGVPNALKILASGFGVTTGQMVKMISTGKVQAPQALAILTKGIENGTKSTAALGGMMDKQSVTMQGALSNISDASTQLLAKAFKPLFDQASLGANKLATLLGSPQMTVWAGKISAATTNAIGFLNRLKTAAGDVFSGLASGGGLAKVSGFLHDMGAALAPLIPAVVGMVTAFSPLRIAFQALAPVMPVITLALSQLAVSLGQGLTGAVTALAPALVGIVNSAVQFLVPLLKMAPVIDGIVLGLLAWKAVAIVTAAVTNGIAIATTALSIATKVAAAGQWLLNVAMTANPIGIIIVAIAALVAGLIWFFTQTKLGQAIWAGFVSWLGAAWKWLVGVAQAVWGAIVANITTQVNIVRSVITAVVNFIVLVWRTNWILISTIVRTVFGAVAGFVSGVINTVRNVIRTGILIVLGLWILGWRAIANFLAPVLRPLVAFVSGVINNIRNVITTVMRVVALAWRIEWNLIRSIVTTVFNAVVGFVSGAINRVRSVVVAVVTAIVNLWRAEWNVVRTVVSTVWNAVVGFVSAGINRARSIISSVLNAIIGFFSSAWARVSGIISAAWAAIVSAVSAGVSRVMGFVTGLASRVISAVSGFGSILFSAGQNLIQGLINGVTSMVGGLVSTVQNIAGNAVSAAKNALGIHSPSTVFHDIGQNLGQGLVNGITAAHGSVRDASGQLANAATIHTQAQVRVNASAVGAAGSVGGAASARPIVMDGNLFGVLQQLANGEARIVLNLDQHHRKVASAAGAR